MTTLSDRYDPGPGIAQCGTINLGTKDIEKSLWFFRDILGMEEVERDGDVSYLRCFQELGHHSLVLTQQDENIVNAYSFRVRRSPGRRAVRRGVRPPGDRDARDPGRGREGSRHRRSLPRARIRPPLRAVLRHREAPRARAAPLPAPEQLLAPSRTRRATSRSLQRAGCAREDQRGRAMGARQPRLQAPRVRDASRQSDDGHGVVDVGDVAGATISR